MQHPAPVDPVKVDPDTLGAEALRCGLMRSALPSFLALLMRWSDSPTGVVVKGNPAPKRYLVLGLWIFQVSIDFAPGGTVGE
jgi:hypothetical protein